MIVEELQFQKKHTGHHVTLLGLWFKDLQNLCFAKSCSSV